MSRPGPGGALADGSWDNFRLTVVSVGQTGGGGGHSPLHLRLVLMLEGPGLGPAEHVLDCAQLPGLAVYNA